MIGETRKKYIELIDSNSLVFGPRMSGKTTMAIYEATYRMAVVGEDVLYFVNKCFGYNEVKRAQNLLMDNYSQVINYPPKQNICYFKSNIKDLKGRRYDRIIFDDSYEEFEKQVNNDGLQSWQSYGDKISIYGDYGSLDLNRMSRFNLVSDSYSIYKEVILSNICPRCKFQMEKRTSCGLSGNVFELLKCNNCGYC